MSFLDRIKDGLNSNHLELIILPTNECNFRCKYCYESFDSNTLFPSVEVGIYKLLTLKCPSLRSFHLGWFGGEPLLEKTTVLRVSSKCQEICLDQNVSFMSSMSTNGALLNSDLLAQLGIAGVKRFQISVDGPENFHNETRLTAGGRGSYKRIMRNLGAAKETDIDFRIIIRIHVTSKNFQYIPAFREEMSHRFNDGRFEIMTKHIENLGGDALNYVLDEEKRNTNHSACQGDDSCCYASKLNSFVIMTDGTVGKCTVALKDSVNHIGKINEEGNILVDSEKLGLWTGANWTGDTEALHCPYSKLVKTGKNSDAPIRTKGFDL